jgi:hypothetical protein
MGEVMDFSYRKAILEDLGVRIISRQEYLQEFKEHIAAYPRSYERENKGRPYVVIMWWEHGHYWVDTDDDTTWDLVWQKFGREPDIDIWAQTDSELKKNLETFEGELRRRKRIKDKLYKGKS